jgi:8-oxo-dGTP pyrophosphatase MutT (NUDIX family)
MAQSSSTLTRLSEGRKNIGESLLEAAVRETYEETGFRVTILPLRIPTLATPKATVEQVNELNTEPIAFSQRLTDNDTLKLIFWFSAQGDSTAAPDVGTQEEGEDFDPIWVDLDSAIETLTFADDRRVVKRFISLVPSYLAA